VRQCGTRPPVTYMASGAILLQAHWTPEPCLKKSRGLGQRPRKPRTKPSNTLKIAPSSIVNTLSEVRRFSKGD